MHSAVYLSFVVLAVYSFFKRQQSQPEKMMSDNDSLELEESGGFQRDWVVV